MRSVTVVLAFLAGLQMQPSLASSFDFNPEAATEGRFFFQDEQFEDQFDTLQGGLIFSGDLRWTSDDRNLRFVFEPYARLDSQDGERNYFDVREANISYRRGDWDVLVGATQIFWGVAESRNVVDIINQFDTVEDFDQVEKLGQPLVRLSNRSDFGTFEAYYLPFFREQEFIGSDGRLRFDPIVDEEAAAFERGGEEFAGDFALRYANTFGDFDIGLHAFYGTSRNPLLVPSADGETLTPFYQEYVQGGLDAQYTIGPWLLKLEAAGVNVGGDTFFSGVTGFEYTFFDVAAKGFDVGVIGEYLFDNRDQTLAPIQIFENDAFAGLRITLNDTQDTEILAGAIVDTADASVIGSVEFQRRIGDNMLMEIEGRAFRGDDDPFVSAFDQDSHLTIRLTRFF